MKIKSLIIGIIIVSSGLNLQSQPWTLNFERDDIKVYTRSVSNSKFKEFKGEMTVNSSLSALIGLLDDVSNQPNWLYNCIEARRLRTISRTEGVNYTVITAPWPVTNRDMAIHFKVTQDTNTKIVRIILTGQKDFLPEKEGIVRVPSMKGQWIFAPLSNGSIRVIYQVHSEAGGAIPASIANSIVENTPYNTLLKMKQEILKPKYKNMVIDEVIEP
ncbi:MAG: START domain-containing protein [Bacteroidales bacterium]|nr:START domain-containing protein [Bacteroidales bacterium]